MRSFVVMLALLAGASAHAADDADALTLADQTPTAPQSASDWRVFTEFARVHSPLQESARASFDLLYDGKLAPGLRAVLSDRLDVTHSNASPHETKVNTLREAYVSWQRRDDQIVDLGRINLRYGAASGYNPTDFFKAGALRSIVSPAPASLRENRLGTVVLQGQQLWSTSSLAAIYSPRLASAPSSDAFSPDFGATNPRHRWLLVGSHRFSEAFNPQLLLFGGAGLSPQAGLNVSGLLNNATVAFGEWSVGDGRSLASQALGLPDAEHSQRRAALGFTTTTDFNLSFTAEAEFNSAAPDRAQWNALRAAGPFNTLRLLGAAQALQDLPVREAWFFYVSWQDMGLKHLDLSAFLRSERATLSRSQWLELRYRWSRVDAAVQWQLYSGAAGSVYATVPQQRSIQLLLRVFL
ncbi:MAG TPA: hypothetical protein VJ598_10345 [Albitalea sp.]|nr:hypothetical protein [Albitalea sp.]